MELLVLQKIFALNVAKLIEHIFEKGYTCTFGEAFRGQQQADIYAAEGRGTKDSLHCKRLAIDLNLFLPMNVYCENTKDYEEFGIFWESLHQANRWGGRFKRADGNHFEMKDKQ